MNKPKLSKTDTNQELSNQADPKKEQLIEHQYASVIVNELLKTTDTMSILNAIHKLRYYDIRLKEMGLRATIKVGTEKLG